MNPLMSRFHGSPTRIPYTPLLSCTKTNTDLETRVCLAPDVGPKSVA